jgi:CubicO group peptidase (beta-lactamase class C family)
VTASSRAGVVESELAARAPAGFADARDRIADTLERSFANGVPPGASLLVVDADGCLLRVFGGCSLVVGERIPTTRDTIYDLASLTKVIVTVTLALWLAEQGRWTLDDPLVRWLPGYPRADTTLRQLLTHTSGLIPHREFYRQSRGVAAIRRDVYAEAAADDVVPGPVSYSDLNYMLLGWALERCAGTPLARLFQETVAAPLGMRRTRYRPPRSALRSIAATELDGDQRLAPGLVWGEVHDGNTWALGGISGHAGLFGPADDLGRFAGALLVPDRHPVLSAASLAEMTRRQAGAPPDVRALGWRLDASGWGAWPGTTYWHTGFTGTSLLVAPDAGVAVVLLLGGVHPTRRLDDVDELRRVIHRSIADALS